MGIETKKYFDFYQKCCKIRRWDSSEAGKPAADRKVRSSTPGPAGYLSPLSKAIYSDTAPLPEKPMAYIWDWWLNSKKNPPPPPRFWLTPQNWFSRRFR